MTPAAAAVAGLANVGRLSRLLRLAGLPRTSVEAVRHLAAQVTGLDVTVSQGAGEPPGLVARSMQIPPKDSLTASWTDFLVSAPEHEACETMARVCEIYAAQVPEGLVSALGAVLWSALGFGGSRASEESPPAASPRADKTSNAVRSSLTDALAEAFDPEQLRHLLESLDRNLDALAGTGSSFKERVFRVVLTADSQGWLLPLAARALEARPSDARLARAADQLGLSGLPREAVAHDPGLFLDPAIWRDQLGQIQGQVCRVDVGDRSHGTGFLVGVDLVLTADFVVREAFESGSPADVVLRFDYKEDRRGEAVTPGTIFELERDPLVARSEWGEGPEQLGYALLRVRNSPGAQPIGGERLAALAPPRRWIETWGPAPEPGAPLLMVHHPQARPLMLSLDSAAVLGVSKDGTRLFHKLSTEPGSSGAPCCSVDLRVVAFHIGRGDAKDGSGVAVLMLAVTRDLERRGFGGLLGARYV